MATTRTKQLIARLAKHGWRVTAVTPRLDGACPDVLQTDFTDVRAMVKALLGMRERSAHQAMGTSPAQHGARRSLRQWVVDTGNAIVAYPDPAVGWIPHGRVAIRRLLATGTYDAVLSSAPPFSTNVMLGTLPLRVPWVADMRDLWTDTDAHDQPLRRFSDAMLERWSLRSAAAITTISPPMAESLRERHPRTPVHVIPNAFDASEWADVAFAVEKRCTLLYAGTFYAGRRDPRPLFTSVRSLLDDGSVMPSEISIDLYAPKDPWLTSLVQQYRLGEVVRVLGNLQRDDVMAAERRADRLLVVLWDGTGAEGTVTGKLFEYLGARRRILVSGGPSRCAIDDVLGKTRAGVRCRDETSLRREVLAAVQEHRRGAVRVVPLESVEGYEAGVMAARFAQLLEEVAPSRAAIRATTPSHV